MKPIIGGPDTPKPQAPRASNGGQMAVKPIPYSPPKGPTGQMRDSPGLGGDNHGNCGTQGPARHVETQDRGGGPGIGGSRMKAGTQR